MFFLDEGSEATTTAAQVEAPVNAKKSQLDRIIEDMQEIRHLVKTHKAEEDDILPSPFGPIVFEEQANTFAISLISDKETRIAINPEGYIYADDLDKAEEIVVHVRKILSEFGRGDAGQKFSIQRSVSSPGNA